MPGRSNRTTGRRGSSASTNGWNSSRLTPMPLHSSSGVQPGVPSRTETRRARPPTVMIRIRSGEDWSAVIDVGSGRVADRPQPAAAEFGGGRLLLAPALGPPARVVRPPGAVAGPRLAQPLLRIARALIGLLGAGLLVAGR